MHAVVGWPPLFAGNFLTQFDRGSFGNVLRVAAAILPVVILAEEDVTVMFGAQFAIAVDVVSLRVKYFFSENVMRRSSRPLRLFRRNYGAAYVIKLPTDDL